jgi:nucleotide-binding universal stress UspA family protein
MASSWSMGLRSHHRELKFMNGPIVVGTDGSDTAGRAVKAAIAIAKTFDQPLHIVSAYRPQRAQPHLPTEIAAVLLPSSAAESVLADAVSRASIAGVRASAHQRVGFAGDAILEVANDVGAALVVVGNRGIGSKARYVVGNVPSRVVHHASCSTYVVETS